MVRRCWSRYLPEARTKENAHVDDADNSHEHFQHPVIDKSNDIGDETICKETEKQPTEDNWTIQPFQITPSKRESEPSITDETLA